VSLQAAEVSNENGRGFAGAENPPEKGNLRVSDRYKFGIDADAE
jgi:hypothetical protein